MIVSNQSFDLLPYFSTLVSQRGMLVEFEARHCLLDALLVPIRGVRYCYRLPFLIECKKCNVLVIDRVE
ncbi:hypothetical protein ASD55_08270 [Rhodanobacter sp. Root561]|nr:hypothetical protein ASD55_08270 [Rhodanobacter sp. Root561]